MDKSPHRVLRGGQRWRASLAALLVGWLATAIAAEAPGAPGSGSAWTTGAKQGLAGQIRSNLPDLEAAGCWGENSRSCAPENLND